MRFTRAAEQSEDSCSHGPAQGLGEKDGQGGLSWRQAEIGKGREERRRRDRGGREGDLIGNAWL